MRSRAPALAAVTSFAVAVAVVAALAGGGGGQRLVKLPIASMGGASADAALGTAEARSSIAFRAAVEYRVEGTLPDLGSRAPAHRLGAVTTTAAVGRLATALGLDAKVAEDADGWLVRSGDRELRVAKVAGLPWYLGRTCSDGGPVSSDGEDMSCTTSIGVAAPAVAVAGVAPARRAVPSGGSVSSAGGGSAGSAGGCTPEGCVAFDPVSPVDSCSPGAVCAPPEMPAPACVPDAAKAECPTILPAPACVPGAVCIEPAVPPACAGATVKCLPAPALPPCPPNARCIAPAPAPVPACPPDAECVEPLPFPEPVRPGDLGSEADARRLAREAFTRLGVGTDGFVVEDGFFTWEARVEAKIDGLPVIGFDSSVSIGPKGQIVRANGYLAVPDRIGDYPLVGSEAGLRRLTDGFGGGPRPLVAVDEGAAGAGAEAVQPELGCGEPAAICVAPPQPEPFVQVVTGVHLALLHTEGVLVPAYAFELKDGGTIPVPAVTDEWLDQQGPPGPTVVED